MSSLNKKRCRAVGQTNKKDHFQVLLADLCRPLPELPVKSSNGGRPTVPIADALFGVRVLAKVVCHNICGVISSWYELGIEPGFWERKKITSKPI